MKPSIFLSHSCKDRELSPREGLSVEEQRLRVERLEFARRIRRGLFERLRATGRYEVWLDVRGGLKTGQDWRDGIHQALCRCAGAVILLSPEALESRWVLKETTILTWRAFLGDALCIIPLLVGVPSRDLAAHGFEPSGIAAIQAEIVDLHDTDIDEVIDRIVERFAECIPEHPAPSRGTWQTTVERWLVETARLLFENDERYAREMFTILGLEYSDEERFGDRFLAVANELLVTGPDEILDVLHTLSGVRTPDQKTMLRRAVEALWVQANAANQLPFVAARKDPPRVVVIDAEEPVTGRDYVYRAYCGKLRPDRIFAPDDHTDGSREQALARIDELLRDYLPVEDSTRLVEDIRRNGPVYVVLGPGSCRAGVVTDVVKRYPALTIVALTGHEAAMTTQLPPGSALLAPSLGTREIEGRRYRRRLGAFT